MRFTCMTTPRAWQACPQPLGQVVGDRQVQERLAAEERQREAGGPDLVQLRLDPRRHPRGRLHRHLRGVLVVVAVVALVAVVAREVALQRREHRHAQLARVLAHAGEVVLERPPLRLAVRHQEPVRRPACRPPRARSAVSRSGSRRPRLQPVEQRADVARHHDCVSVNVFIRNSVVPLRQRHAHVEHRRCIGPLSTGALPRTPARSLAGPLRPAPLPRGPRRARPGRTVSPRITVYSWIAANVSVWPKPPATRIGPPKRHARGRPAPSR